MQRKTKMINVKEKIAELEKQLDTDLGAEFSNYDDDEYIGDVISYIADDNTSTCWSDIKVFLMENMEDVEEAINQFGWDGCGKDLHKAAQLGEYLKYQNELYENLDTSILIFCLESLQNNYDIEEITEDQFGEIEDLCTDIDNNKKMIFYKEESEKIIKNKKN